MKREKFETKICETICKKHKIDYVPVHFEGQKETTFLFKHTEDGQFFQDGFSADIEDFGHKEVKQYIKALLELIKDRRIGLSKQRKLNN